VCSYVLSVLSVESVEFVLFECVECVECVERIVWVHVLSVTKRRKKTEPRGSHSLYQTPK